MLRKNIAPFFIFVSLAFRALAADSSFSHDLYAYPYAELGSIEGDIAIRPGIAFGYETNFGILPMLSFGLGFSCLLSAASFPSPNGMLRAYRALAADASLSYSSRISEAVSWGLALGTGAAFGYWSGTKVYFAFPLVSIEPFIELVSDSLFPISFTASLPADIRLMADRPILSLGFMLKLKHFPISGEYRR